MSNLASRLAASESASSTILAKDQTLSCDTRQTGLNNNALVIGPSGAGKTRNVLKPNLLQMNASYIVLDTKGTLCREVGPVLAVHGYRVQCLNFADLNTVPALAPGIERCGYNPLRHIRRKADGRPNQQDILSVAKAICPIEDNNQPFWDHAAANLLSCLIAYVTEQLPADEQTISSVIKLIEHLQDGATGRLFDDLITTDPQSYALSLWRRYAITQNAERMHASIVGILAEKVMCLGFDGAAQLYRECHQVDFASMGHTPCALFVTVSDIDRNLDPLTGLFITQAFMGLIREADRQPDGSLPVPVRFMLDDFANLQIPQIDNVLSIIRSRNIWATLLLQSTNQLDALYGEARARSIMGNCDEFLYLGGNEKETHKYVSELLGKETIDTNTYGQTKGKSGSYSTNFQQSGRELLQPDEVRMLDNQNALLFIRGERPILDAKYDLMKHPNIRYTEDGGAGPFNYAKAPLAHDDFTFDETRYDDYELLLDEDIIGELF